MIYIAKADILVKVSDIAKNEQISESLLRRIIADLDRKGILDTIK
jgi:DNA-binding IscR family transcriptional regulator